MKLDAITALLGDKNPWRKNPNSIWLASMVSLTRNLKKFKFPAKLSDERRKQVIELLASDLKKSSLLKNPQLLLAEKVLPLEKEFLVEHFLTNQGFYQSSHGEAFMIDSTAEFLATFNLKDHLTLYWLDNREELEATFPSPKFHCQLSNAYSLTISERSIKLTVDSFISYSNRAIGFCNDAGKRSIITA